MRALMMVSLAMSAVTGPLLGQAEELTEAAEAARGAWHRQASRVMMEPAIRGIRVQLPGADPSAALSQAQGAALLAEYLGGSEEVETVVRAARVVAAGRGYVELQRRYRVAGTEEVRSETVLLGYRQEGDRWILTDLRITRN
jgi:hypothetical protein